MANKQTLPDTRFQAQAGGVRAEALPVTAQHEFADKTEVWQTALELGKEFLQKTEEESYALEADATLALYRQALAEARDEQEFNLILNQAETDLKNRFVNPDFNKPFGKQFWDKNASALLAANRRDTALIHLGKERQFGKQSLTDFLENTQNMLAETSGAKGENLFTAAENEITETPFLSAAEKSLYLDKFRRAGVINLALNDETVARKLTAEKLNNDTEIYNRISQIQTRKLNDTKEAEKRLLYSENCAALKQKQSIWQNLKKGNLSQAQYFVLNGSDEAKYRPLPLKAAYQVMRAQTDGVLPTISHLTAADESLRQAYETHKFDLSSVETLQQKLFSPDADFEKVCRYADAVWGTDDKRGQSPFLTRKAEQVLSFYADYLKQKSIAADDTQAFEQVKKKYNWVESQEQNLSFARLRQELKQFYQGEEEDEVWKRYFASHSADKVSALRQAAQEQFRAEMRYPRFYRKEDVKRADLDCGEKFYFNGRLAVMKG